MIGNTISSKKWLCILGLALLAGTAGMAGAQSGMADKDAQMLIKTLSEEKTEINTLSAQQKQLMKLGGRENTKLATMWGRWIAEHKAAGPKLMQLIKKHGGDPMQAKVMKAPVLGSQEKMLDATHKDHEAAVMTSKMRRAATADAAVKTAMTKRVALATKHLNQMSPYHKKHNMMMHDGKMGGHQMNGKMMSMMCPHCNVKMVNGKCPQCGMTMKDMHHGKMKM